MANRRFPAHRSRRDHDMAIRPLAVCLTLALWLAGCSSSPMESRLVQPLPDGGSQTVPEQCRVLTEAPAPYTVKFRVKNTGTQAAYYHMSCAPRFDITSCASGYTDQLSERGGLVCTCEQSPNCPVGGPCAFGGQVIAAGATVEFTWQASIWVPRKKGAYECVEQKHLAPGKYRFSLPLYATEEQARPDQTALVTVTKEFELPTTGGVVDVEFAR